MAKVLDYQCPSCNAPLKYNIKSENWVCDYCNSEFSIEDLKSKKVKDETPVSTDYVTYNCPDCGARVVCDETTSATFCIYCGNTNILRNRLEGEFAPSKIIPFKKTKEEAIAAFVGLSKGRPFMPKFFNNKENVEKITGVYIPFWLYDIKVKGTYDFDGSYVKTWTSGSVIYTKTDTYRFFRTGEVDFNKIPVDGATKFDNAMMNSIEPFDFNKLVDYDHGYLSGFLAEMYDVDSNDSFGEASKRALSTARKMFENTANASMIKNVNDELGTDTIKCDYVLLPVWMVNVKFNDKLYLFAMNGESGEIIGDIPLDKRKLLIWLFGIFAIVFFGILLFVFLIPGGVI